MKEEKEGRKGREEGRRLGHEEGRLTDIAALAITHIDVGRHTHTHTFSQIVQCCSFFIVSLSLVLHPFFSSEREDKRDRERRKRRREKDEEEEEEKEEGRQ